MYRYPKLVLGLIIALALLFSAIYFSSQKKISTFSLTSGENRFSLTFDIKPEDEANFSELLAKLSLPATLVRGASFSLEGSSSSALDFAAPILGTMNFPKDGVSFEGHMDSPLSSTDFPVNQFKFPKSTILALAANDLVPTARLCINAPVAIVESISKESATGLQYLAFFGQGECVLVFNTGNFDLDSFTGVLNENGEPAFKEEMVDNSKISLVSGSAMFQIGQWSFVCSSLEAAKNILSVQKEKDYLLFPSKDQRLSFGLLFLNEGKDLVPAKLTEVIFGSIDKTPVFLSRVRKLELQVEDAKFSGFMATDD